MNQVNQLPKHQYQTTPPQTNCQNDVLYILNIDVSNFDRAFYFFFTITLSGRPGSFHATLNVYLRSSDNPILAPLFADIYTNGTFSVIAFLSTSYITKYK